MGAFGPPNLKVVDLDKKPIYTPWTAPKKRRDLLCGECGEPMRLRNSKHGLFYGCSDFPNCEGTHGAHYDGAPLGVPANKETRNARTVAHKYFDRLWKSGIMKRKNAYRWMRKVMGMSEDRAHIGKFKIEQCIELVGHVKKKLKIKD